MLIYSPVSRSICSVECYIRERLIFSRIIYNFMLFIYGVNMIKFIIYQFFLSGNFKSCLNSRESFCQYSISQILSIKFLKYFLKYFISIFDGRVSLSFIFCIRHLSYALQNLSYNGELLCTFQLSTVLFRLDKLLFL